MGPQGKFTDLEINIAVRYTILGSLVKIRTPAQFQGP